MERKEELELIKIKQQQKNNVQSFGASKLHTNSKERKKKLELPENGNKIIYFLNCWVFISINYFLLYLDCSKESSIVSRYVSSMKKKPSLQYFINRAKSHPYQQSVSDSDKLMPKYASTITQSECMSSSCNKKIE